MIAPHEELPHNSNRQISIIYPYLAVYWFTVTLRSWNSIHVPAWFKDIYTGISRIGAGAKELFCQFHIGAVWKGIITFAET